MKIAHKGECASKRACTKEYAPLCGVNGQTYGNACMAGLDSVACPRGFPFGNGY